MKRFATLAAAIAVAVATPCAAVSSTSLGPDESPAAIMAAASAVAAARDEAMPVIARKKMKPGAYWWAADMPSSGETEVVVNLEDQHAYVYRAGQLVGVTTISSGKKGKETPLGFWKVFMKKKLGFSRKYDNAPMPYMQMYDEKGIAFHGGKLPGYPASHGCIRLPHKFAAKLFGATGVGTPVLIGA